MQIMSLWQSQLCSTSICLTKLISNEMELSRQYYAETIQSILNTSDYKEITSILLEFSEECINDLSLKTIFYNSKELFIILYNLFKDIMNPDRVTNDEVIASPREDRKASDAYKRNKSLIEKKIIIEMKLCHSILKVHTYIHTYSIYNISYMTC
jgi:hypothetical protein